MLRKRPYREAYKYHKRSVPVHHRSKAYEKAYPKHNMRYYTQSPMVSVYGQRVWSVCFAMVLEPGMVLGMVLAYGVYALAYASRMLRRTMFLLENRRFGKTIANHTEAYANHTEP